MASIHTRELADGRDSYRVSWRHNGRQRRLSFETIQAATTHKLNVEKYGHDRAMQILGIIETHRDETTLAQALEHHIDSLTGVEPGTIKRYRAYARNDFASVGQLPLSGISETVIASWIGELERRGNSGKTIANKHGLLSAALARAVREGRITTNPCDLTSKRLPRKDPVDDPSFLAREQFDELAAAMPEHWQALTTWLVMTGMRFSEATALTVGDITVTDTGGVVRISKAWKWTGTTEKRLSYPKSRAGRRTINVPAQAIQLLDLDRPKTRLLFTNKLGDRVTYSRYYDGGWRPAMQKIAWHASPHDLRHTCASWMIAAGVPLPVIQAHLGHESITVTIGVYGHLDRSSHESAAAAIGQMFG